MSSLKKILMPLALAAGGLAALYSGLWLFLAYQMQNGVTAWFAARQAERFIVQVQSAPAQGFPGPIALPLSALRLLHPSGPELRAGNLTLTLVPWRPQDIRLAAPEGIIVRLPWGGRDEVLALAASRFDGVLGDDASARLTLSNASFGITAAQDASAPFFSFRSERISLLSQVTPAQADSASFTLAFENVRLQSAAQTPLGTLLPMATVRGRITAGPPNLANMESVRRWRDAGGTLEVDELRFVWGDLSFNGSGTLALDKALQLEGAFSGVLRGHEALIATLEQTGRLTPIQGLGARTALGLLARPSAVDGIPEIQTPVTAQAGGLYFGPLRLIPLPRLAWE